MSPGYIPFHPNPSKPKYTPPAGAVCAHCHVFGPEATFPFAPKRKYTPCDAPKEKLFALRDFLGLDKNVIVQASCHDTDNRALVDALVTSNGKAKGVAFVGEEITDAELKELDRAGVKGVRFNFIKRLVDSTPKDVMQRIAARVARLGWHIVVYFEQADLDEMGPFLQSLPTTRVVDHMGCPDVKAGVNGKHFQNWLKALDANKTWTTKVTCPERFTLTAPPYDDVVPFAREWHHVVVGRSGQGETLRAGHLGGPGLVGIERLQPVLEVLAIDARFHVRAAHVVDHTRGRQRL